MDNSAPVISVVLPVYNGMAYLKLSVESVLNQDLENFELLIIDDVSDDGSYEYLHNLHDDRIRLFRNETNKGLFYNLNLLIGQSRSDLVKLWAQDDIMYPQCLQVFVNFHKEHSSIGFSYSGRTVIDENGNIKEINKDDKTPEIISRDLHTKIAYYTGSIAGNIANVCIHKIALNKVGLFNEQMKISADFDMWVRLAEHYDTGFIKTELIMLRDHGGQLSRNEKYYINHVKEDLQVYRYLDGYVSTPLSNYGKKIMRQNKFIFYCTLMFKRVLKGDIKGAKLYWITLSSYDNIWILLGHFIWVKLFKVKRPTYLTNNKTAK